MESPRARTILHADMDAFFVSVELRRHPELVGQPVVVGGTGNRGVVAAASYEARRFGVHSALPSAIARRRCPHAVFLPGDHDHYGEVSGEVREIFDRYTPLVEPLSLDEAFLDVTGSLRLFGDGRTIAERIRAEISDELRLACSVGVAPNKFLAKLASVQAKPVAHAQRIDPGEGVTVVEPGTEQDFLDPLPVQRLWGVGPATLDKLTRLGISSVRDLRRIDLPVLTTALGANQAQHLAALAVGADDREVEPLREAKSISHEETFSENVHGADELRRHIVRLADAVAHRLRRADVAARTVTLKVRFDAGFRTITRSITPPDPVNTGPAIVDALSPLLAGIDPSPGVRLIGVAGSNLGPMSAQLSLLDDAPADDATSAIDAIRERFGISSIAPASTVEGGRVRVTKKGAQQWGPDVRSSRSGDSEDRDRPGDAR
ncbi:DNA polymerase IV [Ilumatobacter nonamiensis]|uniref:DNA polymerase IV n=1 Tax=Ilumatobacter nonamiensis TaxID=467093 RepID=UPI0006889481|nr:DNA polymerase IV [Ilumatobacter nonamiensis]